MRAYDALIQKTDKGFGFVELPDHPNKRSIRVWLPKNGIEESIEETVYPGGDKLYSLSFPVKNARLHRKPTGTLVIKPELGCNVYFVHVKPGYRGSVVEFDVVEEDGTEVVEVRNFYQSGRGRLGKGMYALVNSTKDEVSVLATRTGRRLPEEGERIKLTTNINGEVIEETL